MRSTTVIFAAVAALAQFVAATPPACLIHAVGVQANPADTKVLCGSGKDWVIGNITEACGDDTESSVLSIYKSTCSSAGYTVSLPSATATATSASKTASATKTSSASSTASGTDEEEDVSDVWANSGANGTEGTRTGGSSTGGSSANATSDSDSPPSTGAGSALSASSSIFLGSMIAVAGLASQYLM